MCMYLTDSYKASLYMQSFGDRTGVCPAPCAVGPFLLAQLGLLELSLSPLSPEQHGGTVRSCHLMTSLLIRVLMWTSVQGWPKSPYFLISHPEKKGLLIYSNEENELNECTIL